jgi:hypothetical protein
MAITHNLNEGIQSWQWHRIWTKVYKHGNNTFPCLYTFVQAVYYCHLCIPSFNPCVIAMFVYLRSRCVLLPCYTNMPITHAWTKVYKHGNSTRLERRNTNMAITHDLNELFPCWYTFVQVVCYCHVCIPSFNPCIIAMFVYLRSSRVLYTNMAIRHSLNEGIQTWQ